MKSSLTHVGKGYALDLHPQLWIVGWLLWLFVLFCSETGSCLSQAGPDLSVHAAEEILHLLPLLLKG